MFRPKGLLALVGALGITSLLAASCGSAAQPTAAPDAMMKKELPQNLIAAHFVDSSPAHGQTFKQAPPAIVINFNFNLHEKSSVTVTRDGAPVGAGPATLDSNKLALRATLPDGAGDGLYAVAYKACWPDGSCHDGQFGFSVDSQAAYSDMTGKAEVAIAMQDVKFSPAYIIVSRGTKVTWTNRDGVAHFVNTDPHPSHNALPALNSRDIVQGQGYSHSFNDAGEFAYHCSAHYPSMVGSVLVRR